MASPQIERADARAVAGAFFANGALFGAWASRIPTVMETFSLRPAVLGALLLLLAGGAILAFSAAGRAADKFGAVRTTRVVAGLYLVTFIGIGLAPTFALLASALFLFGATHGGMDVAMNSWGAAHERRRARVILPIFHAVFSLGAGLGAAAGSLALRFDLSITVHFAGFALLLVPLLFLPAAPEAPRVEAPPSRARIFAWPGPGLLVIGMVAFSMSLGEGAMADWSAVYLVEIAKTEPSQAALGYTVFSVAMVAVRLSGGLLARWWPPDRIVAASGVAAAGGAALVALSTSYGIILLGFFLMGAGYALVVPLSFSRAADHDDGKSGQSIAGVATFGYGGMLLGPPVLGVIAETTSLSVAFGVLALLALSTIAGQSAYRSRPDGK
ncbi:MAG: MFS transporter [Pseudomonadota bacterium]